MTSIGPSHKTSPRVLGMAACATALLVIAVTTLRSDPSQAAQAAGTTWTCVVCGEAGTTDVLLNLLLFVPLGLSLRLLGWRLRPTVAVVAALTIMVEVTQATLLQGRDASLSDLIANTLGGTFGWWLLAQLPSLLNPSRALARNFAIGLLGLSTLVWVGTGWGLRPEGSRIVPWFGQPTRQWAGYDPFSGTLTAATINGVAIPNDPLEVTPRFNDSLVLALQVELTDTKLPLRPVSVLRIVDGEGKLQLSAGERGKDMIVGSRVRADAFRVRSPTYRFRNAFDIPVQVSHQMKWRWAGKAMALTTTPAGTETPTTYAEIPLSIGLGWVFVHPFGAFIDAHALWWTAMWLALWMMPLGWFLGWLRTALQCTGVALSLALFTVASLGTALPLRPAEFLLVAAFVGIGILAARYRQRDNPRHTDAA